jgi:hypothetical protein
MAASATGATAAPLAAILRRPACAFHLCALLCSSIGSVENPMITPYSYPGLFGVADNNGYGLKVFAFLRLNGTPFKHEYVFDASAAPRGQLPYIVDDGEIFANLITFAHRSVSSAMSLRNSAGDIIRTGLPRFSSRPLIFGSASAALTSRLSRSTIAVGVWAGAPIPDQPPPT